VNARFIGLPSYDELITSQTGLLLYTITKMLLRGSRKRKHIQTDTTQTDTEPKPLRRGRFWRRLARTLVVFLGLVVIIYLLLPMVVVSYMNRKWATMPEYQGHLTSIEFDIFNLQVVAKGISITKKNGKIADPFIYVSQSTITVDWDAWDKGTKAASIVLDSMAINIFKAPTAELSQTPADTAIFNLVEVMMPITRNRLEVKRGTVSFKDTHGPKPFAINLSRLYVLATNLENVDSTSALPARVLIRANAYGAPLQLNMKVNAKSQDKRFELTASLKRLPMPNVNHLLREFAGFDVFKGYFSMYGQVSASNNVLRGYVDLDMEELDVFDRKTEKDEKGKQKNKERWIEFAGKILTNKKEEKISTRVEIEGNLNNPKISIWQVISQAITEAGTKSLTNGFGKKDKPDENSEKKPTFLEKVFDKDVRKEEKAKRVEAREEKKEEREKKREDKKAKKNGN